MCWERERIEGRSQLGMEREGKFPGDEEILRGQILVQLEVVVQE